MHSLDLEKVSNTSNDAANYLSRKSNSARLSHFSWKHQKRSILRDFLVKNGKLTVQLTASYQCVLRFFHAMSLKYCACHEKVSPGAYEMLQNVTKKHLGIADDLIRQNATPLRKSAPWVRTSQLKMPLVLRTCHEKCICADPLQMSHAPSFLKMLQNPHVLVTFQWMHNPLHFATQNDVWTPKCFRATSKSAQFLTLFTSKCASRHNAVHFFDISTSKSAPRPTVFNTFYVQMCFAPQRRALFRHLNFQNCSEPLSF